MVAVVLSASPGRLAFAPLPKVRLRVRV